MVVSLAALTGFAGISVAKVTLDLRIFVYASDSFERNLGDIPQAITNKHLFICYAQLRVNLPLAVSTSKN